MIPISVMPICTVDRNLPGSAASGSPCARRACRPRHRLEPRLAGRYDGELRHREDAVERDQREDDRDVDPGKRWGAWHGACSHNRTARRSHNRLSRNFDAQAEQAAGGTGFHDVADTWSKRRMRMAVDCTIAAVAMPRAHCGLRHRSGDRREACIEGRDRRRRRRAGRLSARRSRRRPRDRTEKIVGAGIGGLAGAGIGAYMDKQERELRERTAGTDVHVIRQGDDLVLNMPSGITFATNEASGGAAIPPDARSGRGRAGAIQPDLCRCVRPYRFGRQRRFEPGTVRATRGLGRRLSERRAACRAPDSGTRGFGETQPVAKQRDRGRPRGESPGGDQARAAGGVIRASIAAPRPAG
jgi:hypothetical protein